MSAAKRKGTQFESALVVYLNEQLPVTVERRALQGAKDRGDVSGIEGVVIEAKAGKRLEFGAWLSETEHEADNDHGSLPILVAKRRGKGDVGDSFAVLPVWALAALLRDRLASP